MQNYILIVNQSKDIDGNLISAMSLAKSRLMSGQWWLYSNTRNRKKMAIGDRVIIYLAGYNKDAKVFLAKANIAKIDSDIKNYNIHDYNVLDERPDIIINLDKIEWLSPTVPISIIKDSLDFIPKHSKWGCVLQGGTIKISESDANKILTWNL